MNQRQTQNDTLALFSEAEHQLYKLVQAGMAVVVSRKADTPTPNFLAWAEESSLTTYIGRANSRYGLKKSDWSNPYKEPKDGSRKEIIEKFTAHLHNTPTLLARIPELRGRVLVCWCSSGECHGDILASLANAASENHAEVEEDSPSSPEDSGDTENLEAHYEQETTTPPDAPSPEDSLHQQIYTRFLELVEANGGLTPVHREELHKKRGLTDETIARARLVSADFKAVNPCIQALIKEFTAQDVVKAGLAYFPKPGQGKLKDPCGGVEPVGIFSKGEIIIPYFSSDGRKVVYIRCHKMGPSNVDLEVYGQEQLARYPKRIVITEGEFKSLALQQCGIQSIGIPGISSFAGKHFSRLLYLLTKHKISEVVILFDNEIKEHKPDPLARWDTDYWACYLANRLFAKMGEQGTSVLIARFPDSWRIDGKIDPDSAVAAGHTADELRKVIEDAVIVGKHVRRLPQEGQIVVGYRLAKDRLFRSPLKEEQGMYKWQTAEAPPSYLSNFALGPKYQRRRANGTLERVFTATNALGEFREVILDPSDLSSLSGFTKRMENAGNFVWQGNYAQLIYLKERIFTLLGPKQATETESFGRQGDGTWIFGDAILSPQTKQALRSDEDGIVWKELEGILPLCDEKDPAPKMHLPHDFDLEVKNFPMPSQIYKALRDAYDSPGAGMVLGWSLACIFSDEIYETFGHFPILGLFAEAESGKSHLADLIRNQWGDRSGGVGRCDLSKMTKSGVGRLLSKYRSMPILLDEYRNGLPKGMETVIRSIYDRTPLRYAEKSNDLRTVGYPIRACAILSGEEIPNDQALRSRCIEVPVPSSTREDGHFDECNHLMAGGLGLIRWTILHSAELAARVVAFVKSFKTKMHSDIGKTRKERILETYTVPLGALAAVSAQIEGEAGKFMAHELMTWVTREIVVVQRERNQFSHVARFFDALAFLATQNDPSSDRERSSENGVDVYKATERKLNGDHVEVSNDGSALYLHFPNTFKAYKKFEAEQKNDSFSEGTIRDYLKKAPYVATGCDGRGLSRLWGRDKQTKNRVWRIDLTHPECPERAKELADILMAATNPEVVSKNQEGHREGHQDNDI